MSGGTYTRGYLELIEILSKLNIDIVYSGHDQPVTGNVKLMLETSLNNIKSSKII